MRRVLRPKPRLWVISALLVALIVRALIPAGFMPSADRPFSFQVCPDGFPAALLPQEPGAPAGAPEEALPATPVDAAAQAQVAGDPRADAAPSQAGHHHHHDGAATTPAGHLHHDGGALAHAGHHHDIDGLLAAHHHGGTTHDHNSARAEHCVFAAAAGAFALAFAAAFSAPATSLAAPEDAYVSPSIESRRFLLPQPRGPPSFS